MIRYIIKYASLFTFSHHTWLIIKRCFVNKTVNNEKTYFNLTKLNTEYSNSHKLSNFLFLLRCFY